MNKLNQKIQSKPLVNLCTKWLGLIAFLHILGGLSLSFDFPASLWFEYRKELMDVFNIHSSTDIEIASLIKMLTQLFGPTIASWGLLMLYLVGRLDAKNITNNENTKMINVLILSTLIWFVLDSSISYRFNMMAHLVINSLAVMSILLPLVYLRFQKGV